MYGIETREDNPDRHMSRYPTGVYWKIDRYLRSS